MGFWVGFWVGLRARDFPTERVLSRTPLIIRTVVLSICMVRPGSGRFGVGFWVGLRAWDFPTERVLSRTPLTIRTVDQEVFNPRKSSRCSRFETILNFGLSHNTVINTKPKTISSLPGRKARAKDPQHPKILARLD